MVAGRSGRVGSVGSGNDNPSILISYDYDFIEK